MKYAFALLALLLVAACGQSTDPAEEPAHSADVEVDGMTYAEALAVSTRLETDYERDASRKPDQVLEFFGIEPGMCVLDMFSGGGYYSEIIAQVVGEDGLVLAHSNEAYLGFVGEEFTQRYANDRLTNVELLMAENNELDLNAGTLDAAIMVLAYHDVYYSDPDQGWPKIDIPIFLGELYKGLKPGGILGIVDHRAEAGAPSDSGNTVHRIDPAIVIADLEAAGFVLDGSSDLLSNPDDDHSIMVFNPEVRGKTDRFILRFKKPE